VEQDGYALLENGHATLGLMCCYRMNRRQVNEITCFMKSQWNIDHMLHEDSS
jgi:hypothetical protein